MEQLTEHTALLIIDVQQGFSDPQWGVRNNSPAESNIKLLLDAWRNQHWPVIHVQHDSRSPEGVFFPGTAGNLPKPETAPHDNEPVYRKSVNSAFIGTHLEDGLRTADIDSLVVVELTTQHCVSTTTRMAGNLGFWTHVVSDATATFDQIGMDGRIRAAADVHYAALSDLNGEFATVVETRQVLASLHSGVAHNI